MSGSLVLGYALLAAQLMLALAMALAVWRIVRGPRAQDRVLGLDTLYVNALLMMVTFGIRTSSTLYFEAALVIGLLGFASTVALAKFLMRGEVIE
jgi:multicomponent K+:H+ antiporter subunit F